MILEKSQNQQKLIKVKSKHCQKRTKTAFFSHFKDHLAKTAIFKIIQFLNYGMVRKKLRADESGGNFEPSQF